MQLDSKRPCRAPILLPSSLLPITLLMDDPEGWLEVEASRCQRNKAAYLQTADAACLQQQVDHPVQQSAAYDVVQVAHAQQDPTAAFCNGYKLAGDQHARGRAAGTVLATVAAAAPHMQQANLDRQQDFVEAGGADSRGWRTTRRAPLQHAAAATSPQLQQRAADVEERPGKRHSIDQHGNPQALAPPATPTGPYQHASQHRAAHVQEEPIVDLEDKFLDEEWHNDPAAGGKWAGLFQRSTAPAPPTLPSPAADTAATQQQYAAPHTQQRQEDTTGEDEQDDEVDTSLVTADFDLSRY